MPPAGGDCDMVAPQWVRKLFSAVRDETAVSATEYAVMLALIVLVAMAIIQAIGSDMMNIYANIDGVMPD
jgi:Flp pilus assembly pilin Flp